jgi:exo-beta-1,3-glucanase (GH17 family)
LQAVTPSLFSAEPYLAIASFALAHANPRYTHNFSKFHQYSDVFMNANNHEYFGTDQVAQEYASWTGPPLSKRLKQ